jgi:predicted short-subunit dehydrogenase-like oxidoreductase (DUF2520 family)
MVIGFIGSGKVGFSLGKYFSMKGITLSGYYSEYYKDAIEASEFTNSKAYETINDLVKDSSMIFITTPDDSIEPVASSLRWNDKHYVIHCSGAHSTDILKSAKDTGAYTGGFHPLQTFAGTEQAIKNIPGSTFGIESQEPFYPC